MRQSSRVGVDGEPQSGVALAARAARELFDDPRADVYEPVGKEECSAAVEALAARFQDAGGTLRDIVDNARAGARLLSSDRLQGLVEIVQNADDVGATEVVFSLSGDYLRAVHNGRAARLRDIHALAAPWLTTKVDDVSTAGRFGVGLSTLHSIAEWFEFRSGDYQVRIGSPSLVPVKPSVPGGADTEISVPLEHGVIAPGELLRWADGWDDSSLLFMRHVRAVTFVDHDVRRDLRLEVADRGRVRRRLGTRTASVHRLLAVAPDGRKWTVERASVPAPAGLRRSHKATGSTTTIGVALPHQSMGHDGAGGAGGIYARLPLSRLDFPAVLDGEFDPTTGRQALADTPWNAAVAGLVVDLWIAATVDFFAEASNEAWHAVPADGPDREQGGGDFIRAVEDRLRGSACRDVGSTVKLTSDGQAVALGSLAYEVKVLEGLLTGAEICALAGVDHSLTTSQRDAQGRWRRVIRVWERMGVPVPAQVTAADALSLASTVDEERADALVVAAIDAAAHDELRRVPWIRLADGSRICPPPLAGLPLLDATAGGPSLTLGVGVEVDYREPSGAPILEWLHAHSTLGRGTSTHEVLEHLARVGQQRDRAAVELADDQLSTLRSALEDLPRAERARLGAGIGRVLTVDGLRQTTEGSREPVRVFPPDAYLPAQIDRDPDSFAVAARRAPGLTWIHPRYQDLLRSPRGRDGLGARAMLVALGARTAPAFADHPGREFKYGSRRALPRNTPGSPALRTAALVELRADVSLGDLISPDLEAVLKDIGVDDDPARRRRRARAALVTIRQLWPQVADDAIVQGATGYYEWRPAGPVPSWWLAMIQDTPWLDDGTGSPRRPIELRQRTAANEAVYGRDPGGYLHPDLDAGGLGELLHDLGVAGEPTDRDLLLRLRAVRREGVLDDSAQETARSVYAVLAARIGRPGPRRAGQVDSRRLRQEFVGERLLLSSQGWVAPGEAFRGPPVFGPYKPSVPQVPGADALWVALGVPLPGMEDCVDVLRRIARNRQSGATDASVHLDTLRLLASLVETPPKSGRLRETLRRLPLRTYGGWTRERPVFALDDPAIAPRLGERLPVWDPGGDLGQFRSLLGPLRVTELPEPSLSSGSLSNAYEDDAVAHLFALTVEHMRDDLARNDPRRHASIGIPWDDFARFRVAISPGLRVTVVVPGQPPESLEVDVGARLDLPAQTLYIRDSDELGRADGAGRAVAALFPSDRRTSSHAWVAAAQAAVDSREVEPIRTAAELAAEALRANARPEQDALRRLQAGGQSRSHAPGRASAGAGEPRSSVVGDAQARKPTVPRRLVELASLELVDPAGRIVAPEEPPSPRRKSPDGVRLPTPVESRPQGHGDARGYTDLEKETLAMGLLRWVLKSDDTRVRDLRAQRNAGADAVDDLVRFFELKVSATSEPDRIRLESSQVRRAMEVGEDFFLVIVSGLEGEHATPRVRIIDRPLERLTLTERTVLEYGGIAEAGGLIFEFGQATPSDPDGAPGK